MTSTIFTVLLIGLIGLTFTGCTTSPKITNSDSRTQKEVEENVVVEQNAENENSNSTNGARVSTESAIVPLPTGESTIHTFFSLIGEKRISAAISMLASELVSDDAAEQAWGVQFNNLETVKIIKIEPWQKGEWTKDSEVYKVTLSVSASPESAGAPIPFYGWDGDPDIRWVRVEKNAQNLWRIAGIATGP